MQARLIRMAEVLSRTSLTRAGLYRLLAKNSFPAPMKLMSSRVNAWSEQEVDDWIADQLAARDAA